MTDTLIDEMADAMHMANATPTHPSRRVIPRSGYSRDYNQYLIAQAEAALAVVKQHFILTEKP